MIALLIANFLMFALLAVAGYFAWQKLSAEVKAHVRANIRQMRRLNKKSVASVEALSARVEAIELIDRKKSAPAPSATNPFVRRDERENDRLSKVLSINGQDVTVG